jgi:hypothetical protein
MCKDSIESNRILLKIELLDVLLELLSETHAGPLTNLIHNWHQMNAWMNAWKCLEVDHGE